MMKFVCSVVLSGVSFGALAQAADSDEGGPPPGWGLGLAAAMFNSPYAGEGTRVVPIPLISYQGERFYFRGISAGWQFYRSDSFEFAAVLKPRLDGFKVDDLGRVELARNGIDYRLIEDRKGSVDAGVAMKWSGAAGELELEILADVADKSGGQEASLQYGYPFDVGGGTLTPQVGVTWLSKDNANYYYGTLDKEIARGVIDYKPGSAVVPHIGVSYFRPLGEKWTLMGSFKYSSLPDEITASPFVEPDTDATSMMFLGFSRRF
jgi:outer membrane protein